MRTHVSYNGCLQRATKVSELPANAVFVSYGRHVNPSGSYVGAPTVALYKTTTGFVAI